MLPLVCALVLGNPIAYAQAPAPAAVATATTAAGVKVSADVRATALAGFSVLVTLTVRNESTSTQSFPDLSARPHLVRFSIDGPRGKTERFTTPPAFDVATTWTLAPGAERRVVLEIPSSSGFAEGSYTVGVSVAEAPGTLQFSPVAVVISAPRPVGGTPVWEPTIAQNLGALLPWVHDQGGSKALYLMHFDARVQTRALSQHWLADLPPGVDPVLSRSRPGDSFGRFIYWLQPGAKVATVAFGRLDGTSFRTGVKTVSLPYPTAELFDRGMTDSKGQMVIPIWLPAPSGTAGSLKAWTVNERGIQSLRNIVDLPAKPTVHATAVDAGADLLLAIGVAGGLDVYKIDADLPSEIPAQGTRHYKAQSGWTLSSVAFETLPDAGDRPGGLSVFGLLRSASGWKSQWSDLSGNAFAPASGAWSLPGTVQAVLTSGYGPFYAVSKDDKGNWWYQPSGGVASPLAARLSGTPALFISGGVVRARALGGLGVVTDVDLGPVQQ